MTNLKRVKSFDIIERDMIIQDLFSKVMSTIGKAKFTKQGIANDVFWEPAEKFNTTPEQALAARTGDVPALIDGFIRNPETPVNNLGGQGGVEELIINNIQYLSVLYTILVERGVIQHDPVGRSTQAKSPLERCSDCGVSPDKEGRIWHTAECKAYKIMVPD
jgi:hypothetical protein